jgi:hypothetical protein
VSFLLLNFIADASTMRVHLFTSESNYWSASFCEPQPYSCIRRKKNPPVSALLRRIGMLADQHSSLPQCEPLIGPMLHGLIESSTGHENRPRSGDNPSDMQCVPIPQLHAKAHVGDVVQVRVFKLAQQLVHAPVETVVRSPNEVRFGAQALEQTQRVELAIIVGVVTH